MIVSYNCWVSLQTSAFLTHCWIRDFSQPYVSNDAVKEARRTIYTNTDQYWNLYELAEKLVDLEDWFLQWRFRHMKTVERIIGFKRGTGGTSGVSYLKKALDIRFFPELWELQRTLSLNHFGGRPPFFHGQSVCTQGFWNPGAVLNNLMTEAFAQIEVTITGPRRLRLPNKIRWRDKALRRQWATAPRQERFVRLSIGFDCVGFQNKTGPVCPLKQSDCLFLGALMVVLLGEEKSPPPNTFLPRGQVPFSTKISSSSLTPPRPSKCPQII